MNDTELEALRRENESLKKRLEQAQRFERVIHALPFGMGLMEAESEDPGDLRFLYFNPQSSKESRIDMTPFIGKRLRETHAAGLAAPEEHNFPRAMLRALRTGEPQTMVLPYKDEQRPLGGWFRVHFLPIDRNVVASVYENITEARETARLLYASEQSLKTTLMSIGDAVISTDVEGRVVQMNPVAEQLTGWTSADAKGQRIESVFNIINEGSRQPVENPVVRALREGTVVGLENHTALIARDGVERLISDSAAPIRAAQGEISGAVLVFRDQTEERRAEQRRLADAQQLAHMGSWEWNIPANALVCSEELRRIFGFQPQQFRVTYEEYLARIHPDDRVTVERTISEAMRTRERVSFDHRVVRPDGSVRSVHGLGVVVADSAGKPTRMFKTALDITERKALEDQIRQAQKMEAVGRLAGGVAHDFNNILSIILSYGQMVLSELKPGEPMREDLEEIVRAGKRASDLTRQLLMFSRQQAIEPKVVDLNDVLASMDKMLQRILGADVDLVSRPAPQLGKVRVDPSNMEQVIMNLVVNARDAMPTGGKLTMETGNVVLDESYTRDHLGATPGPHVMLAVADTGSGMDKATVGRIFEPFFTTKPVGKGTGLGLSTVFGIVQQCGGNIWVYSEPGKGTTFKVYLPAVDAEVDEIVEVSHLKDVRGSETILLVEDDDQVRAVAASILRKNGYHVIDARNAGEALLVAEKHPNKIHLLLSDVVMPQMSGPELAERLASVRPDMRVLCMSGYTDDSIVRHGVLEAHLAYLQKPLTPDSLTTKVREVLDAANGRVRRTTAS